MEIVKSEKFGWVTCDIYQDSNGEVWMTRNQIGEALGYENPNDAIRLIHSRNEGRLSSLATTFKLNGTDGKAYETIAYSRKGVFEVCRFSRQPKADIFIDFAWKVMDFVLKTGSYSFHTEEEQILKAIQLLQRRVESQKAQIAEMIPKVEAFETFVESRGLISIQEAGKILSSEFPHVGPHKIFRILVVKEVLFKDFSGYHAYQNHIHLGRFEDRMVHFRINGVDHLSSKAMATAKGMVFMRNLLLKIFGVQPKNWYSTRHQGLLA